MLDPRSSILAVLREVFAEDMLLKEIAVDAAGMMEQACIAQQA
jgi:hypothetical protein